MPRREHVAGGTFLLVSVAFALAPVSGQSPSAGPSGEPGSAASSAAPTAQPTLPPGGVAPLPARIVSGSCAEPGDERLPLNGPIAGGEREVASDEQRPVYASISVVEDGLDAVVADGGALVVGGRVGDPAAAVACGDLDGPRQSEVALAIALEPTNESGYTGTVMLHEEDGRVRVTVVVVGPPPEMTPDGSPAPSEAAGASPEGSPGSTMPVTSPGTSGAPTTPSPAPEEPAGSGAVRTAVPNAITSPVPPPTVQPGTSGAPPFSPLPQASAPLPGG